MHIKKNTRGEETSASRFAKNALWLIGVSLLMRTVGVSFNVYLSQCAGSEVMGLHSLLMGVYGLAMTLGCGGVNLGTTRLVAEAMGTYPANSPERATAIKKSLRTCLWYAIVCGSGAALLMYVSAPLIGSVWLKDVRTVPSLRILALSLPPIALASCLSGYFTGMRRVGLSSTAGVLSQCSRLAFCILLIRRALPNGTQATCQALVLGGALAEGLGLLLSYIAFLLDRRLYGESQDPVAPRQGDVADGPASHKTGQLLRITIPVTLAACLRSGLVTLEHALIPRGLEASGASWGTALASYGVLHGVVLPVVLFPSAFISSFSGLLVPEVAESRAAGHMKRVAHISRRILSPALIFSFGVAGLMACFSQELGLAICKSAEAGRYIRMLAPLVPIMYVDSSVDGILKGMGQQVYSMAVNIVDALVSVILVWWLLPRMGLNGFILTIYVTETLNTTLSLCRMLHITRMPISLWHMVAGPLLCILGATWAARLVCPLFPGSGVVLHLTIGTCFYLALLVLLRVVGKEEWMSFRKLIGRGDH